jgi:hypothetical protein
MAKPQKPPQAKPPRMRSSSRYKRSETARLLRGAADAGLTVSGFEIDPVSGVLRVLVDKIGEPDRDTPQGIIKNL